MLTFTTSSRMKHHTENSDDGSGDDDCPVLDLGPVEYPAGEHRLQHPYCLWFSKRRMIGARNSQLQWTQGYSRTLRLVGQLGTVEQWWALYSHIVRLHDLPPHIDLHLFKKGIQPMWEDPVNSKGGKWVTANVDSKNVCELRCQIVGYTVKKRPSRKSMGKFVYGNVRRTICGKIKILFTVFHVLVKFDNSLAVVTCKYG